jgi:hypothetical protein
MLRIRLEVKANRPKEFVPVKYEYTNGVVSSEQLQGKTLYYTVQNVYKSSSLAGSFRLYTARKFDASNKFNGEVKVNGGKFYDGHDYASLRFNNTIHYYTLRKSILFTRIDKKDNHYIFAITNQTIKQWLPEYLVNVKNITELDEKVKFIMEPFDAGRYKYPFYIRVPQTIDIYLNIHDD